ncbi:MAG: putative transcriptional regulator [Phormidesmis priestleyi Ana]|uniref:Putative transcriptional regulator n=1 Tax=Phormidesmis priestleyi Ana TaxID=1666911 RepID=A0A0P7Z219_9CYAN|nr:MAG: putative transcriptional regulator [Phormidesmis priestleyi Ana]
MKFEDIYQFFEEPPPIYLNKELAVCYVLSVLTRHDSYGTELIHAIEQDYANYRLSDTVLYSALKFLENQAAIMGYWKKVEGRGRPRRMYRLRPDWQMKARELADLWQRYMTGQQKAQQRNIVQPTAQNITQVPPNGTISTQSQRLRSLGRTTV